VLSLWDYEGKLESRLWSDWEREAVLRYRLRCPPAKMLRSLLFAACELVAGMRAGEETAGKVGEDLAGLTADVSYSPLELKEWG